MQNINILTTEQIKEIGSFCFDNQTMLDEFMNYQSRDDELFDVETSPEMESFLLNFEPMLFRMANYLSKNYKGGHWGMEHGFFCLNGDDIFQAENQHVSYELNAMEFSIVCNLYALSSLAMSTYNDNKPAVNHLSVFFSDYIKELIELNRENINTRAIWHLID